VLSFFTASYVDRKKTKSLSSYSSCFSVNYFSNRFVFEIQTQ